MTQAFNLSQLANKVNTSGQLDASTGLSSAVPVANGGLALTSIAAKSIPVANSANTYTTVTPAAGQSVRVNAGNTAWEAFTPGTGTVTSVATGNGLQGGTITSTGTLSIAAPGTNTVGSYFFGFPADYVNIGAINYGTTIAGSSLRYWTLGYGLSCNPFYSGNTIGNPSLSGTWMALGATYSSASVRPSILWVRIS